MNDRHYYLCERGLFTIDLPGAIDKKGVSHPSFLLKLLGSQASKPLLFSTVG
jgi:hypothetical protein